MDWLIWGMRLYTFGLLTRDVWSSSFVCSVSVGVLATTGSEWLVWTTGLNDWSERLVCSCCHPGSDLHTLGVLGLAPLYITASIHHCASWNNCILPRPHCDCISSKTVSPWMTACLFPQECLALLRLDDRLCSTKEIPTEIPIQLLTLIQTAVPSEQQAVISGYLYPFMTSFVWISWQMLSFQRVRL